MSGVASARRRNLPINVKDYGAKGDGVTDDATAIQAAITVAAATGGTVYFPRGVYRVGTRIVIKTGVSLVGEGQEYTTIRATTGVTPAVLVGLSGDAVTDVRIRSLKVDADYSATALDINGIQITNGTRVVVENCAVTNVPKTGIFFSSCVESDISDNAVSYTGQLRSDIGFGALLTGGTRCKVRGNRFTACNGMNVGGNTNATFATVYGNDCDHTLCPSTTVSGAGQTPGTSGTLNVTSTTGFPPSGTLSVAGIAGAITYTGKTATSFTGCAGATGTATNGGVARNGYESIGFTAGCTGWIVEANRSVNSGDNGISASGDRAVVVGNYVDSPQFFGVLSSGNDSTIGHNVIRNPGTIAATGYAGVGLNTCTNNSVAGNRIFDDRGTPLMTYGIKETGTAGGHRYASTNRITGSVTSAYLILSNSSSAVEAVGVAVQTYGVTVSPDASSSRVKSITVTDTNAFTIANPSNPTAGAILVIDILNSSGGTMGTITWGSAFLLAGSFTNPANGKHRTVSFYYNSTLAKWLETGRAAADI